jgi:hypothetical protein
MNKAFKLVAFFIAILAPACTDEVQEAPISYTRELTFTATREGVSPVTKTVRMDDGSTWWNAAEEISVFYGSGSNGGSKFISKNTTLAETTEFEGSISMSGSKEFWAVYPYSTENSCDGSSITTVIPDIQTGSEGNFSGDVFPAMAKSSANVFAFWNICGGIKFFVSRSDIKSVTFKGNGGEVLAGKVRVSISADSKPEVAEVYDGKTEVTLNAPDGGTFKAGKYYYLTLLPTTLDGGFTMTFNSTAEQGTMESNNAQTVKRSIFGVLKNIDAKVSKWESTWVEPEYVDLGLSVRWATINVGATKPEEYGDYFAWGETEPKTNYNWSTYKWCNGDGNIATKYCTDSIIWDSTEPMDNKTVLDPEDDAAFANWGGNWRMPTDADLLELCYDCTWTWTEQNGVKGSIVTGSNGNSIFLPAAGTMDDTNLKFAGEHGVYWSSSLDTNFPRCAWFVVFHSDRAYKNDFIRSEGHSVRAVYDDRVYPESLTLNKSTLTLYVGDYEQLTPTVLPENAAVKSVEWSSDNREVATVYKGVVTAYKAGTATITATTALGAKTATCEVMVVEQFINGHEAVDLGLPSGLRWATMNVGSTKPEDNGDYFAWGETQPKDNYNWSTYKWCNGDYNKLTKYCTQSSYWDSTEPMDTKTVLDLEDDAARADWGGSWRMPTDSEWRELRENCTLTWTTQNGVNGRLVTSKTNSKSIFLPAAGFWSGASTSNVGSIGRYWSSSLCTDNLRYAWSVLFNSEKVDKYYGYRYMGFSVRPVTE